MSNSDYDMDEFYADLGIQPTTHEDDIINAALQYANGGYKVFFCKEKKPWSPDQREDGSYSWRAATSDPDEVRANWAAAKKAGRTQLAVNAHASGVTLIEADAKAGVDPSTLIGVLGEPTSFSSTAGRPNDEHPYSLPGVRGAHWWFAGSYPQSELQAVLREQYGDGIDVRSKTRGEKGNVGVVAPSIHHKTGEKYEGELPPIAGLPELPAHIQRLLLEKPASVISSGSAPTWDRLAGPVDGRNVNEWWTSWYMWRVNQEPSIEQSALMAAGVTEEQSWIVKGQIAAERPLKKHEDQARSALRKKANELEAVSSGEHSSWGGLIHTHTDMAHAFSKTMKGTIQWPEGNEAPYVYEEGRWQTSTVLVRQALTSFMQEQIHLGHCTVGEKTLQPRPWTDGTHIDSTMKALQYAPGIACAADAFDNNPYLLGMANGVLDLRNGELVPNTADLRVRRMAKAAYVPEAGWDDAGREFIEGVRWSLSREDGTRDQEMEQYVQFLLGVALYGGCRLKAFYYLLGAPNAGKSTFTDTLVKALGDYASTAPAAMVTDGMSTGSNHTEHLVPAVDYRLVVVPELTGKQKLDSSAIKTLTGEESVSFRRSHGHMRQAQIDATILLMGNLSSVRVDAGDSAIKNRLRVIPFERSRKLSEADASAPDRLRTSQGAWDAVISWAAEGAMRFANELKWNELKVPQRIIDATENYVDEHDQLGAWLTEAGLENRPAAPNQRKWPKTTDLRKKYQAWAVEYTGNPFYTISQPTFLSQLRSRGVKIVTGKATASLFDASSPIEEVLLSWHETVDL